IRSTLLEIDGELGAIDVERLKFLTKDHLPHGGLAKASRGIDVFSTLEQKGKLRENDTKFLQECFHYMQRRDLVRKIGGDPDNIEDVIQREGPNLVLPFRILLFNIAEDIGEKDLNTMKFYARNQYNLSKKQVDSIKTCLDLFNVLEREGIVQPPEVRELENMINSVGDEELRELIDDYKKDHGLKALCRVFENKLKFKVERHNDLTAPEIIHLCQQVAKRNHKKFDAFVMCILSHGNQGNVYGTEGKLLEIRNITSCFTATSCQTLADKPKLFFFQACQGTDLQKGATQIYERQESTIEMDVAPDDTPRNSSIPDDADFLFGYATVPGYASIRSRSQGSFYIMTLVEALEQYASRYECMYLVFWIYRITSHFEGH
ncbi:hypothetical protein FSP39_022958, partial [Pinctada imbricata]